VGSNVGQLAESVLVEPFPQLIAGTPLNWGYDQRTRAFQVAYTTAKGNGHGRFAPGAITEIATPRHIYGRPYAVHVHNGAVVSRRGAGLLRIAACPGARKVLVEVFRSGQNRDSCRHAPLVPIVSL
jgi:endoglycosylceramidase